MNQQAYLISASYGEYDDFTRIPMFICYMQMEADLFVDALNNREQPYWEKAEEYFIWNRHGIRLADLVNMNPEQAADLRKYCIPEDIGFSYEKLNVLTLLQQHPNT